MHGTMNIKFTLEMFLKETMNFVCVDLRQDGYRLNFSCSKTLAEEIAVSIVYGFRKYVPASVFVTDKKLKAADHQCPFRQNFGVVRIYFQFVFYVVLFPSIFQAGGLFLTSVVLIVLLCTFRYGRRYCVALNNR